MSSNSIFLTPPSVARILGQSRVTLSRFAARGDFGPPVYLPNPVNRRPYPHYALERIEAALGRTFTPDELRRAGIFHDGETHEHN